MRNTHIVSANHVHPDYRFDRTEVRVSRYGGSELFYASHPKLGCGKNASTPERAIYSLFSDSACTVTKIEQVADII